MLIFVAQTNALRCYMDSSDPSHPGIEECLQVDGDGGGKKIQYFSYKICKIENTFKIASHV